MKMGWKLKRPISILLCSALLMGSMPTTAWAEDNIPTTQPTSEIVTESKEESAAVAGDKTVTSEPADTETDSNVPESTTEEENLSSDVSETNPVPEAEKTTQDSDQSTMTEEQPETEAVEPAEQPVAAAVAPSLLQERSGDGDDGDNAPEVTIPEETSTVDYSKQQSECVTYEGYELDGENAVFEYKIAEDAGDSLTIDLAKGVLDLWEHESQMPGDHYKFQILIENESGNQYRYKDNSFVLAPGDASKFGNLEDGSALPVLTYDGQYLPILFAGSIIPYYFYEDVFGVSRESQVTFEMVCQIYDYLAKKGYTGDTAITDYMLDYYNNVRGTEYTTLTELFADHPDWADATFGGTHRNGIWTMTEDELLEYIDAYPWIDRFVYTQNSGGKLKVQVKWPEPELAAVSYNSFYMGLFSAVFGEENANTLNPNGTGVDFSRSHGVGDYLPGTELYNETNQYFASLTYEPLQPGDTLEIWSGYGIDGPGMGNSYQNYSFTYFNTIELEKVKPIQMSLADITIYTGGNGYDGVVENGNGEVLEDDEQGFPTPGFYIDLPEELNEKLGENQDLSPILTLHYDNGNGDIRSWKLELYGTRDHSTNGTRYVYKFDTADAGMEAVRVQLTPVDNPDGGYILSDDFEPALDDQYKEYEMSVYNGSIDQNYVTATIKVGAATYTYPVVQGNTAKLTVRANNDEKHAAVVDSEEAITSGDFAAVADADTEYYLNDTEIQIQDTSGVKLMVDTLIDEQVLVDYLKANPEVTLPEGNLVFVQKYMDLVDTNNGDAYLTLGDGQQVTVYWPVPEDYIDDGNAVIYHFDGVDRDYNTGNVAANIDELIQIHPEIVTVNDTKYFMFSTSSFSPFVLAYANSYPTKPEEPDTDEPEEPTETTKANPQATPAPVASQTKAPATAAQTVSIPQTSDESNLTLWVVLMLVSGCGAVGMALYAKKKKYE